ncbi:hypothetical protein MKW94_009401 [Papaver nudicaule]|uniref:Uncharacterized protein n=1 Tax=Papaver nudicaule TaxID=74823 RepID=A0AA41VDS2_PAPNU|nr:hypothetical protein [Papaver nudicaule]
MATRRIIKRTASSLISLANHHRNHCISTIPGLLKKKNLITSSSSSSSRSNPRTSIPILCYSSLSQQGLGDAKVNVETPSEFPFKIEDKPGNQTITLTRKYGGDDIKVIVHMPADHSSTVVENGDALDGLNHDDQHKDNVGDAQSSIRLVVTSKNFFGTTLEYGVIAHPDDFLIDSFCIKYARAPDENIYYKGPDYVKLDKNLQKEFKRRLKIRGIIPSTTNFLHKYMANRDMYSSADSSNSPPLTTNDQSTPESIETTLFNDEGIPVDFVVEQYRQRGHPLVSAEDIRNSGKKHKDFIWIPYPYTRSEKLLWIEVPSEGFAVTESELRREKELCDPSLVLDSEDDNPYRRLPPKEFGDPPVFSEEMDMILYPDLKVHMTNYKMIDYKKAWEECRVALKEHHAEMEKIKYPHGRAIIEFASDEDREYFQAICM